MIRIQLAYILCLFSTLLSGQYDANQGKVFKSIQEANREPLRVYHLDLSQQNLEKVPKDIVQYERLITLNLAHNTISSLEGIDFSMLKKLESIVLYDNDFRFIPCEALKGASALRSLDLGENDIKKVDPDLNQLNNLEYLELSGNRIQEMANDIQLPYLKTLKVDRNYLNDIPDMVYSAGKLEFLNLYGNNIRTIPNTLSQLSKLHYLNLGDNPLEDVPVELNFPKLQTLILDWVDLSKPDLSIAFINNSTKLEVLSLENCKLRMIPEEIAYLRRLKELSLLNNDLHTVRPGFSKNKKLAKVWLGGNVIADSTRTVLQSQMKKTEFIF